MIQITCNLAELQGLIKPLRQYAEMNQSILAGRSGYNSAVTISNYENGERTAKPADLAAIFEALGYDVTVVLTEKATP